MIKYNEINIVSHNLEERHPLLEFTNLINLSMCILNMEKGEVINYYIFFSRQYIHL